MPFIHSQISAELTAEKEAELREKLGRAIALLPGKSEEWLMLRFSDNCRMAFRGKTDAPMAMVEVKLFGASTKAAYAKLTAEICRIFSETVGIPSDHIYVKYEACEDWGYDGFNF